MRIKIKEINFKVQLIIQFIRFLNNNLICQDLSLYVTWSFELKKIIKENMGLFMDTILYLNALKYTKIVLSESLYISYIFLIL